MRIFHYGTDSAPGPQTDEALWVYNGLDCMATSELFDKLNVRMGNSPCKFTYKFERALLGPVLTMMRRGIRVNEEEADRWKKTVEQELDLLARAFDAVCRSALWDKRNVKGQELTVSIASTKDLQYVFYNLLNIPEIVKTEKGKRKVSMDREALEAIAMIHPRGTALANMVLAHRDLKKQFDILNAKRDSDGRLRTGYNVAGTVSGRLNSKKSPFWTGTNLQNVTDRLRKIFEPDPGNVLFYADLSQAESRATGYIAEDEAYIDACESGDLHTTVAKMLWPELPWTGDLEGDVTIAKRNYYRDFSYRDMCKRAGHGTNYGLSPHSMARNLRLEIKYCTQFNLLYLGGEVEYSAVERWNKQSPNAGFNKLLDIGTVIGGTSPTVGRKDTRILSVPGRFPGIKRFHERVANAIQSDYTLTTPMWRRRVFWDRVSSPETIRSAISYLPQSLVADVLNYGMLKMWETMEPEVQLLLQVHDAVLGQMPKKKIDELCPRVVECLQNPINIHGRTMLIPSTIELGLNWAKKDKKGENPFGIQDVADFKKAINQ